MIAAFLTAMIVVNVLNVIALVGAIVLVLRVRAAKKELPKSVAYEYKWNLPAVDRTEPERIREGIVAWYEKKERREIFDHFVKFNKPALEKLHEALHESIAEKE